MSAQVSFGIGIDCATCCVQLLYNYWNVILSNFAVANSTSPSPTNQITFINAVNYKTITSNFISIGGSGVGLINPAVTPVSALSVGFGTMTPYVKTGVSPGEFWVYDWYNRTWTIIKQTAILNSGAGGIASVDNTYPYLNPGPDYLTPSESLVRSWWIPSPPTTFCLREYAGETILAQCFGNTSLYPTTPADFQITPTLMNGAATNPSPPLGTPYSASVNVTFPDGGNCPGVQTCSGPSGGDWEVDP